LETVNKLFGQRLRAAIQRHGFTVESFSREMGVRRSTLYNWFERDDPPPSKKYKSELVRILGEPEDYLFRGVTPPSTKSGHLKTGGRTALNVAEPGDTCETVASRFPQRREPSNRADCLAYMLQLLDAAEVSGNPDNFPAIMARLKKQFPLDEWEEKPE
jgi:transcriptional regulator with XRE-family HTH domain